MSDEKNKKIDGSIRVDRGDKKLIEELSLDELKELSAIDLSGVKTFAETIATIIKQMDMSSIIDKQVQSLTMITKGLVKAFDYTFDKDLLTGFADSIKDILKDYEGIHLLDGYKVSILSKNYWVMPFEYNYEDITKLEELKSDEDFEKVMLEHFSDERVKRLFDDMIDNSENDKKVIMEQIKQNYFLGNYAICVNALISFLEGVSLEFLDDNSDYQGKAYAVYNDVLEYYETLDMSVENYQDYLHIKLVANFCDELFGSYKKLKNNDEEKLNRHPVSHGAKNVNKQIEVLRLANTVELMQKMILLTNLKGMFEGYKDKKDSNRIHYRLKQS